MAKLQPIETAPKDGTKVFLWWDGDFAPVAMWRDGKWNLDMLAYRNCPPLVLDELRKWCAYEPTHWFPLPEATEVEGGETPR